MTSQVKSHIYVTPIRRKVNEDDLFSPQIKSKRSNPSTVDQSCISPRKCWSQDAETEEFEICQFFQDQCCCPEGENCERLHQPQSQRLCRKMDWPILQNYPELVLGCSMRKKPSFLK